MKKIILFFMACIFLSSPVWATTYYIDCNANGDAGAGTGTGAAVAWKTIAKVNASSFSAGDSILFNKGCTWREQLTPSGAGSTGTTNTITYGAYGTGANPIINGSDLVTTWVDNSGGGTTYDVGLITYEGNNLTEWTSETDTASKLSVAGGSVIDGTYSMKIVHDSTTSAFVTKTFTQFNASAWTVSFKIRLDSAFAITGGTQIQVASIENAGWGFIFQVYLLHTGGTTNKWRIVRNRPSYTAVNIDSVAANDTTYTVTITCGGIGGSSGTYDLSVNGSSIYSVGSLNFTGNAALYQPDMLSLGVQDSNAAAPAGNIYYDSVYADKDNVGTGGLSNSWYAAATTEPKVVYFNGTRGTNVASIVACDADKKWYWASDKLYTYGMVNPNTTYPNQIEAAKRSYAIQDGYSYLTFQNLDLANANSNGLNISAWARALTGVVVDGVTARGNYATGISVNTDGNGNNLDTVMVKNSIMHHNGLSGISVGSPDATTVNAVTVQSNTVYSNNIRWDATGLDKAGIHAYSPYITNLIIQDNDVYDNGDSLPDFKSSTVAKRTGHGIYPDTIGAGLIVRRNKTHNNNLSGITFEYTDSGTAYYNLAYSNGYAGLSIYRLCHNNTFYNNTSYGNYIGLAVWADGDESAGGLTGNLVKNNIALSNTIALYANTGGENDGTNGSGNVYTYNALGPQATDFIKWGAATPDNYAAWYALYAGANGNTVQADPLLVSTTDFHLQPTSPAADAGVDVGLTSDYSGAKVPQRAAPSIGAYEYIRKIVGHRIMPGISSSGISGSSYALREDGGKWTLESGVNLLREN